MIDFAAIDQRIAGAVAALWTDVAFPASPHSAVVLRFHCVASRVLARQLCRPRPFPTERPVGCPVKVQGPDPEIVAAMREATELDKEPLNVAFQHLVTVAEAEICARIGEVQDGVVNQSIIGRGVNARTCWKPALPRGAGEVGRADTHTFGLQLVGAKFAELAGILGAARR